MDLLHVGKIDCGLRLLLCAFRIAPITTSVPKTTLLDLLPLLNEANVTVVKTAIMAIETNNSTRVNPFVLSFDILFYFCF